MRRQQKSGSESSSSAGIGHNASLALGGTQPQNKSGSTSQHSDILTESFYIVNVLQVGVSAFHGQLSQFHQIKNHAVWLVVATTDFEGANL